MRKLVAGLFVTLDGVVEAPEEWNPPYFNEEMSASVWSMVDASDTTLFGRKSYQRFEAVFAGKKSSDQLPFADVWNERQKYVVSSTLGTVTWHNSTLISDNVNDGIAALKDKPGKNISVAASATLIRSLLAAELLDELSLLVHPVVVGHGARLFDDVDSPMALHLTEAETFKTGVVRLVYSRMDTTV
jgi:dihydrofolate reductase